MTDREKLVELVHDGESKCSKIACKECEHFSKLAKCKANMITDHLIANGVTFATDNNVGDKLSPTGCDYCREDADGYRVAFGAFSLHNPFHNGEWEISTGHCKPRRIYFCPMCGRRLPQPPKGE